MSYTLNYIRFPAFLKSMKKYNQKNKGNKQFKEAKREVIEVLKSSPRYNQALLPHPLKGKLQGIWSINTGLNSNADRVLYIIDDENKIIYLYDIGDHTVYESLETNEYYQELSKYWIERNLI